MATAIFSLSQVHGAELWLAGWALCTITYFAVCLLLKPNRCHGKNVLFWFLTAEVLTDLAWALIYYRYPVYVNYGIGAVYGLLLWPVALCAAGVLATRQNQQSNYAQ